MGIGRENRIDLLRGLSLLLIFIGHAEFTFSAVFQNARGFSDASETFVLLAGLSSALAYYRPGAGLQLERPWRRAFRLYLVHLLLFGVMVSLSAWLLLMFGDQLRSLDIAVFWTAPGEHAVEAIFLAYMPGNLDILPMYVVLLVLAPFIFVLHDRSKMLLACLSVLLWLAAGLGHLNLPNLALQPPHWYFDPLSWQLIFTIGVVLGIRLKSGNPILGYHRAVFGLAAVFAILAIPANIVVHFELADLPFSNLLHQFVSKTNEGPLRIINALAILYLAWNIQAVKRAADSPVFAMLVAAGRHSLPVFSAGVLLSCGSMVMMRLNPDMPVAVQMLVLIAGCALQLGLGRMLEKRRQTRRPPARPEAVANPTA
ncbi:OpgC family protein [Pararhizobium gei]|uniref:OpgC family protein n=1 Tax=Pararhizobium gei TaxID=1395951 RepID=UPI0023DCCA54|nr:OpgC domain-containing protein [Rhizobium gei]